LTARLTLVADGRVKPRKHKVSQVTRSNTSIEEEEERVNTLLICSMKTGPESEPELLPEAAGEDNLEARVSDSTS